MQAEKKHSINRVQKLVKLCKKINCQYTSLSGKSTVCPERVVRDVAGMEMFGGACSTDAEGSTTSWFSEGRMSVSRYATLRRSRLMFSRLPRISKAKCLSWRATTLYGPVYGGCSGWRTPYINMCTGMEV